MPSVANYYANPYQYALEDWTTSTPEGDQQAVSYGPGWAPELLDLRQKVESGQATPWDREWYGMQERAARAVPMRDASMLEYNAGEDAPDRLSGGSPDLGNLMLTLQDKMRQGQATPQERSLFDTTYKALVDQNYRASVPQASDAFSPLGDNLFSALGVLGLGATGGLAAAPLFAGGAGLATTLGSLGTLSGIAGTGAGVLGQATDQEWMQKLGLGLGIAGGLAGGLGGLSNLWSTGVNSLSDAAKLAQSAGQVTGALGRIPGAESLGDVSRYLDMAGKLGSGVNTIADVFDSDTLGLREAFRLASGLGQVTNVAGRLTGNRPLQQASQVLGLGGRLGGNVGSGRGAAQQAQPRGGQTQAPRPMTDADWLRWQAQPGPLEANAAPVLWNL